MKNIDVFNKEIKIPIIILVIFINDLILFIYKIKNIYIIFILKLLFI